MEDQNITLLLEIKSSVAVINEKVTRLDHAVLGNSKPGLLSDHRELEAIVKKMADEFACIKASKEKISGRQWSIWLLIISNVVALCFQLVRTGYIK